MTADKSYRPAAVLARLAGGRDDIFEEVSGSRTRFTAMGGVLVSTAGLAFLSAAFALRMALAVPVPVAVLLGAGWAVVILTLDRMLIVGMGHERSLRRNLAMAAPRVALAVVLGTVISTPLTLQIFHKEIDRELVVMHQRATDEYKRQLAEDPELGRIPELEQRIARAKTTISGGGTVDASKDPRVTAAQAQVDQKQAVHERESKGYAALEAKAQCELNGGCGTRRAGVGTAYREAKASADRQLTVVNAARRELDAANRALAAAQKAAGTSAASSSAKTVDQAGKDLAADEKELARLVAVRAAKQAEHDARTQADDGILARLEALDEIGGERPILLLAHLLLWALFLSIEVLPVLMKLLLNVGPVTAYDRALARREDGDADLYDALARIRDAAALDVEQRRVDRQRKAALQVDRAVVRQQKDIVREALAIWGLHAQARARRQLDAYEQELRNTADPRQAPAVTGVGPWDPDDRLDDDEWSPPPPAVAVAGAGPTRSRNAFSVAAQLPDPNEI